MKKIYKLLSLAMLLLCVSIKAQPVNGITTFFTNTTTPLNPNTACSVTKTTSVSGWLFSVQSTSNCGFNWTNTTGGDGRIQYLVGFGTLTEGTFGSDDGSQFAMNNMVIGVSTSSWVSKPMTYVGYLNGSPVPGATLNAMTPGGTGITNTITISFTGNPAFNNVDEIKFAPNSTTCSSIYFIEQITIGTASCAITPSLTLASSSPVSCNGGANGTASISANGGSPFTYTWSPSGGNSAAASGLSAGNYTCAVTNACGISATQTVSIVQPSALITSTAVTNVACNGGSNGVAAISGSGGTGTKTYLWSNGATTSVITGLLAGVYTATVTDANGCKSIKSAIVTQPSALVTTTAVTNVACNGGSNGVGSVTASGGAGGYSYLWSNGATTSAITGQLAGIKTVTVTDANSCTSIKSVNITQPSALVTTTAVTNVACNGGSNGVAAITASGGAGGYTYLWSNGGTTSAITGLLAGVYTATVTDANSCIAIKSAIVTQPSALVTTTAVTNVACNGGNNGGAGITASGGAGGYTYLWSNGATTSNITGVFAGVYTATVTDANSCISIKSVIITQPSAVITSTAVTNAACYNTAGSATVMASGGTVPYTYVWSSSATSSVATNLFAGVYTITVTDANSCTSIKSVIITQPSALITNTAVNNITCLNTSGSATLTASGGTIPYTYLWSSSATSSIATNLFAGVHTCTVTDGNNCTTVQSVNITSPSALFLNFSSTPIVCNGGIATVTISATGGSAPYTGTGTFTTFAGVSTYTVTDANSCATNISFTITQPPVLSGNALASAIYCNGGVSTVTVSATGGTPSYTGVGTYTMLAGTTNYTITDSNGCSTTTSATATQPAAIVLSQTTSVCAGQSYTIGASTYTASGIYTNTLTSVNGCDSTVTTNLTVQNPIDVTTTLSGLNIAANNTIATSYQWVNCINNLAISGATVSAFTATTSGSYAVSITQNGCSDTSACVAILTTGIKTNDPGLVVSVSPNPNNGQFSINLSSEASVEVIDALGKLVYHEKLNAGKQHITLQEAKTGIYFVKISAADKQFVRKIVIEK